MATTTLTHKIRNPKQLSNWLELWTANIEDVDNYIITPSDNWDLPTATSSLSTMKGNVATYEDEDECLSLDINQVLTDATLSSAQQGSYKTYSLSTIRGNVASYNEECLNLGRALISAILTS